MINPALTPASHNATPHHMTQMVWVSASGSRLITSAILCAQFRFVIVVFFLVRTPDLLEERWRLGGKPLGTALAVRGETGGEMERLKERWRD